VAETEEEITSGSKSRGVQKRCSHRNHNFNVMKYLSLTRSDLEALAPKSGLRERVGS
jgi:hypothetical protein